MKPGIARRLAEERVPALGVLIALLSVGALLAGRGDTLVIGVTVGIVYGIVALGLVIIYKGSRVVNFAHGQMALVGAFAAWGLLYDPREVPGQFDTSRVPWALAAIAGVAAAALAGVVIESTVIRRLFSAPRLIVLVATIAAGEVLRLVVFLIWLRDGDVAGVLPFRPPIQFAERVGSVTVLGAHLTALVVVPLLAFGLAAFFKLSRFGIAIRAASDNADAARLLGISVRRVSMITWGLGAGLAAVAGILIAPVNGGLSIELLGTGLLIRALAAAVLGGLTSLVGALVGGLTVGIAEALLVRATPTAGLVETLLFFAILAVLLVGASSDQERGTVSFAPSVRNVPTWIRNHVSVGGPRFLMGYWLIVAVAVVPILLTSSGNFVFSLMLIYAMLGVSLNLLMGTAGQISLGHFALLGVGAFASAKLVTQGGMPYPLAFVVTGLIGGLVAFAIGLPSLRIRGLYLAIATLAFAVAAEAYLFRRDLFGSRAGLGFDRPSIGPFDLASPSGREFSYVCLAMLAFFVWIVRNVTRHRSGRALLAVRDNETSSAVLGVSVRGYKLLGFTLSGVLAAWAGMLYGMLNPPVQHSLFVPAKSLDLVAMVIIGGLGSVPGAILGAVYVVGLPRLFPGTIAQLLATGVGLLAVLMIRPGGLWSLVTGLRDFYVWALTVNDRAFKGPLSHLVPEDVPEAAPAALFADMPEEPPTEAGVATEAEPVHPAPPANGTNGSSGRRGRSHRPLPTSDGRVRERRGRRRDRTKVAP